MDAFNLLMSRFGRRSRTERSLGLQKGDALTIHVHEDDWGMRSLHPLGAREEVQAAVDEARRAGQANQDPTGLGWDGVHPITPPELTFVDVGLTAARASEILVEHLPRVRRFVATSTRGFMTGTPRDSLGVYDDEPLCFGRGAEAFVKLDLDGDVLAAIWFDLRTGDAAKVKELRGALLALDAETRCVIADYSLAVTGAISDAAFLDAYFAALTRTETKD